MATTPLPGAALPRPSHAREWGSGVQRRRAISLLRSGLRGANIALLLMVGPMFLLGGRSALVATLVSAAVVMIFFSIGQGVQVIMAERSPAAVLWASMISYLVRVVGLGVALKVALSTVSEQTLPARPLAFSMIVLTTGWIISELITFSRMRMPVYDAEYQAPTTDGTFM